MEQQIERKSLVTRLEDRYNASADADRQMNKMNVSSNTIDVSNAYQTNFTQRQNKLETMYTEKSKQFGGTRWKLDNTRYQSS